MYFDIKAKNADGRLERVQYANGVSEKHAYDPATGRLVDRDVVNAAGTVLLHQSHSYDWRGLLATRSAATSGTSETFGYDDARRLIRHAVNADVRQYAYDLRGNLLQATQSGNVGYSAQFTGCPVAIPQHQPCSTSEKVGIFDGNSTFTYDENGRQTRARFLGVNIPSDAHAENLRSLEFNSFDLPWSVYRSSSINGSTEGREYLEVSYDAFGARTMQRSYRDVSPPLPADAHPDAKQIYIGDDFEVREQLGVVTHHVFIGGPEGVTVEVVFNAAGGETLTRHLHRDLLGSVDLTTLGVSPSEATVEAKQRYEAYGARLTPSGSRKVGAVGEPSTRGFTGHYHDDSFDLINMRGRIYDQLQRRFLTPDPVAVYAAGSHRLRSERTSTDPISSLGELPFAGLQGRDGSDAELQGPPGGSSPGSSDGISYNAAGLSGSAPSTASASRRPGAPRAVGLSYANDAGPNLSPSGTIANGGTPAHGNSMSFEDHNPYCYTYNNPVNYVDPSGYCPICIAVGVGVGIAIGFGTTLASDDAAKQREAHPEAAASPAKGMALSVGVLGPAAAAGGLVRAPAAAVAARGGASAIDNVVGASGGSIRQAVTNINQGGLTQSQAVQAIVRVTEESLRQVGGVVDIAGGAKAVIGVMPGVGQPIVYIAEGGATRFGSATVSIGVDASGKLITTVTDVVLP